MTTYVTQSYNYYAGIILVLFCGYSFFKLRFIMATFGGWSIVMVFNLMAFYTPEVSNNLLISNNFFLISANLIGMASAYNAELHGRRNYYLNKQLDEEKQQVENLNLNLEKKVRNRTRELVLAINKAEQNSANIKAIIEGTNESIWAFNNNYKLLYVNKHFKDSYYKTFGILLKPGVNLFESLPKHLIPKWKNRYDRVLNNEQFGIEDVIPSPNGNLYIHVTFNPIVKGGKVIGGTCFGHNITYRKLAELEMLKAKAKAEKSDRLKTAFLANMSHEIRTPMNGIIGFAELLKEPNLSGDELQAYIGIIEKSGQRMLDIINDIIDISKIEAGLMQVHISEVDINEKLNEIYTLFKREAQEKQIDLLLKNKHSSEEITAQTDKEKLFAILSNLVKNAIKYTNKGSVILSFEKDESALIFTVKDSGIGISQNRLDDIFERFMQEELSGPFTDRGAGLGLSIVKEYTNMLNGRIEVKSKKSKGSIFNVIIPLDMAI
jgi:signal transduction histidine kinase